ncbi:NAD-dependent epimerase/dehydratase family protein [Phenylobacterium sp.]|uniref:NAD-dependent epimerase/dehydratase family protein n=1 Tax=Phenylobacterium sp. TaxID=1871053 RepID=UPI0035B2B882
MAEPILILGADGFVGRNLRRWCEQRGRAVHLVGRAAGDLTDPQRVDAAFRDAPACGRIIHLVTRQRTGPTQYEMQAELLSINARIHLNVLEAWRRRQPQAKLISAGSSCAYPDRAEPLAESLLGAPGAHPSVAGYAQAKLLLAQGSRLYGEQYGLDWLHCIFATLYGPFDHPEPDRSHFVGGMLRRAQAEQAAGAAAFTVWGRPEVVREVLFVEDQIEALFAADAVASREVLNCAANTPITVGAVAEAIRGALNWRAPICYPEGSFASAPAKVLDSSAFLRRTGWRPRWSLEAGLAATLGRRAD